MISENYIKKMVLPSDKESLKKIISECETIRVLLALEDETYFCLLTCMNEAVQNALVHGNHFCKSRMIKVDIRAKDRTIEVCVEDEGCGFNILGIKDPTLPQNIKFENGRGLFIIKHLSSQFEVIGKGNIVRFVIPYQ